MKKFRGKGRGNRRNNDRQAEVEGTAVVPYENEHPDSLIRRFKRKVESSGVLKDLKNKKYHVSKGEAKRLKREAAEKRRVKREAASKRHGN